MTVGARGFGTRTVYEDFQASRKVTIRVYRPELQWPMYGATPDRAQAQSHIRLRPPFRTRLEPSGSATLIEFPAVVDDGVAYIGNARGTIRAISMRFGRVLWRHDTPYGKMASSPAVVGRELVYHTMDGHVFVLDRATGRLRWHFDVGSPVESSPIVRHGIDYFGAWNGRLYALDLRTRRLRWTRSLGAKITSSAAIAGGRLFIGDYGGRLWAISPRTGATRWARSVNGRVYGTPAVAGGRVFVPSSTGGSLTAFSVTGRYLWRVGTGAYVYSSPAAWGGRVFFGSYNGVFYGVSAASGRVLWTRRHGRADLGRRRRRRRRRVRRQLRAPDRRRRRAHRAAFCCVSGTGITFPSPETGCAYFFTATLVSMQWSQAFRETSHRHPSQATPAAHAQMRRAAAGVAAVLALAVPAVAQASTTHDAAARAEGHHACSCAPLGEARRRAALQHGGDARARATSRRCRGCARDVIASQLSQMTPLSDSYTSPRALSLFSQLETNLDYLETHRLPTVRVDVTDDDGVVYRWFPRLGLEFHPLANFGALNNAAATGDVDATRDARRRARRARDPARPAPALGVPVPFLGRPSAVGFRHGAGRGRAVARARFGAPPGSRARRGCGARLRIGAAVPALAAERPLDPPLRVQRPGGAERAAPGDPLAPRVLADRQRTRVLRRSRSGCRPRRRRSSRASTPATGRATSSAAPTRRASTRSSSPTCSRSSRARRRTRSGSRRRSASTRTTTTRRR